MINQVIYMYVHTITDTSRLQNVIDQVHDAAETILLE